MKNWEKKIYYETQELLDINSRLQSHEAMIEKLSDRYLELEKSIYQTRPKKYIQAALDFLKKNKEIYSFAYKDHYEDLVYNMEDMLAGYENYRDEQKKYLPRCDRAKAEGLDLIDFYNDF